MNTNRNEPFVTNGPYNANQTSYSTNQTEMRDYSGNQGYQQGVKPGQGANFPPPPQVNVTVMPAFIGSYHPQYAMITQASNSVCPVCSYQGGALITSDPGCVGISWSVCLYLFFGLLFFWIPLVMQSCKDVTVRCGRCKNVKFIAQKQCC